LLGLLYAPNPFDAYRTPIDYPKFHLPKQSFSLVTVSEQLLER